MLGKAFDDFGDVEDQCQMASSELGHAINVFRARQDALYIGYQHLAVPDHVIHQQTQRSLFAVDQDGQRCWPADEVFGRQVEDFGERANLVSVISERHYALAEDRPEAAVGDFFDFMDVFKGDHEMLGVLPYH